MARSILPILLLVFVAAPSAQDRTNFSGTWVFNPSRGQNLGMMTSLEDTVTITQTAALMTVTHRSRFQGQESTRELHFDLTGKAVANATPMGDSNQTVVRWSDRKVVVIWTGEGAVAGTTVVRTETHSVSADGKTLTVESLRGDSPAMVMVYDRK